MARKVLKVTANTTTPVPPIKVPERMEFQRDLSMEKAIWGERRKNGDLISYKKPQPLGLNPEDVQGMHV